MFLLQISLAILALLLLLAGIRHFDRYTARRFGGHRFFAPLPLIGGALAVWSVAGGLRWTLTADVGGGGVLLAVVGIAALTVMAILNVRRTSVAFGLTGSAAQFAAFAVVGYMGIVIALPALMLAVAAAFGNVEPRMRQTHLD